MNVYSFKTRARTVDHLGREQIADTPTAVSELWKNAYDAYARSVSLHIFDGDSSVAAVMDDGIGMTSEDIRDKWLVLGTDAKLDFSSTTDTNGLPPRVPQGQKGIGRLSVAFLGPLALLISKRDGRFVATMVDWRLFENPSLMLEDIGIPVEEFSTRDEFQSVFRRLLDTLVDNVWGDKGEKKRNARVKEAWNKESEREKLAGLEETTADQIATAAIRSEIEERHLQEWSAWNGTCETGTALFVLELRDELRVWIDPERQVNDDEAGDLKKSLTETLTGFVDPFTIQPLSFNYSVVVHRGSRRNTVISNEDEFGLADLRQLEHYVDGECDEYGVFTGRVHAFGKDLGEVSIAPAHPPKQTRLSRVGPFAICLGTFEQAAVNSLHPPEIHRVLQDKADRYSGLRVYRDGLRVMPYGRPAFDFFGIEARRTSHAGREFWQHQRMFGRLALTKSGNPNLRDKAGREGIIDNTARRELRSLVVDLLKTTARRYFGTDSNYRDKYLAEIQEYNKSAEDAARQSARARTKEFLSQLRRNSPLLESAAQHVSEVREELSSAAASGDRDKVWTLAEKVEAATGLRSQLKLPPRPNKLGTVEAEYREFRDRYNLLSASVEALSKDWAGYAEALSERHAKKVAESSLTRHQKYLTDQLGAWGRQITSLFSEESIRIAHKIDADRSSYFRVASPMLAKLPDHGAGLRRLLIELETAKEQLFQEFSRYYPAYIRALEKLAAEIDLDSAVNWSTDRRSELESQVTQLNALAQLGITVEIIGHELESLDREVSRNLNRLPKDIRDTDAYKLALVAHQALIARLRFLAPLKLSGPKLKDAITGNQLGNYIEQFFSTQLRADHVDLEISNEFRSLRVVDFGHRLFPVFVNLVNNSLYWVKQSTTRRIRIDMAEGEAVVADSGPGVDPDDVDSLFALFFSRRVGGRGVGLYLCRANLAASGHSIRYQNGGPVLSGANFLIRFQD